MKHARTDYNERIQDTLPPNKGGIPHDEPVFLLRAQDRLSADTLDFWADALESNGGDDDTVEAVREHANLMRNWPRRKLPDTPPHLLDTHDPRLVDLGSPDTPGSDDPLEGAE